MGEWLFFGGEPGLTNRRKAGFQGQRSAFVVSANRLSVRRIGETFWGSGVPGEVGLTNRLKAYSTMHE